MQFHRFAIIVCLLLLNLTPGLSQTVRFRTTMGDIDVTLLPESAPATVQNFLNYMNRGAYNNSFFHRSVRGFVIQGGGFRWQNTTPNVVEIPSDPPVRNEYRVSNTRGTIAMAKLGSGPDTATNQWFFNLADNSSNLNNQNGGFTVFGRVTNAAGLAVMDRLAAVSVYAFESPFDSIPLTGYSNGSAVQERHLLIVRSISLVEQPAISNNGVITASNFGGFPVAAPGSFVEIYGSNLADPPGRGWAAADFNNGVAPTSLEGVSVLINGVPAYVNYVSPGQVNVQLPAEIPTGGTVTVVVNNRGSSSPFTTLAIKSVAPGMLAPAGFKVGDKQFIVAARPNGTLVGNGAIPDVPNAPAQPGETLIFYGTGFGAVTPSSVAYAGRVVQAEASIAAPVEFKFGAAAGKVVFAGLAPGLVGVYQFNVTLPADLPAGDVPIEILVDGQKVEQTLYLPARN